MDNSKYNRKPLQNQKIAVGEKRKRTRFDEKKPLVSGMGDSDSVKSRCSKDSVIYMGTDYLPSPYSVVDLTKTDSEAALRPRKKQKKLKSLTTIQPVNSLSCKSSEDMGLVVLNADKVGVGKADITESAIQLKRTYPFTSVEEPLSLTVFSDPNTTELLFVDDVSKMISGELGELGGANSMVFEMDIETIVELFRVDKIDHFDHSDI